MVLPAIAAAAATFGLSKLFNRKKRPSPIDISKGEQELDVSKVFGVPLLRDLVTQRLGAGQGLGFGADFLDRAASAPIKQIEARQREITEPYLSSELSKRGVARSVGPGLATDVMTRARQSSERDIGELLSRFYVLNEAQKKGDVSEAINVAQGLGTQEAGFRQARVGLGLSQEEARRADEKAEREREAKSAAGIGTGVAGLLDILFPGEKEGETKGALDLWKIPGFGGKAKASTLEEELDISDFDWNNLGALKNKLRVKYP